MYLDNKETERLTLRPLTVNDVDTWRQFLSNEEAVKYFPDYMTTSDEQAEIWISKQLERYQNDRYGLFALEDKATGEFIGQCGLLTQTINGKEELEVGYHVMPHHWGKGYATEAAHYFKEYGFIYSDTESIIAIVHVDNIGSQVVAERNGLVRVEQVDYAGIEVYIYRMKRSRWSAAVC